MARQRIGSSSVSSLLRSANAAQSSANSYQDQLQAYTFDQNGRTPEAYSTYVQYLKTRTTQESDPSRVLALTKAQDTAFKGYKSAEIQNLSTQINYGGASLYDKRNALDNLYAQAASIGDQSTMNSIELQRSNLDIQIQKQEQSAADTAAKSYSTGYKNNLTLQLQNAENDIGSINTAYKTGDTITDPATGKAVRVTDANKGKLIGAIMAKKMATLEQVKDDPNVQDDPTYYASILNKITDLQNNNDYIRFGKPNQAEGAMLSQDVPPTAQYENPHTGLKEEFKLPVKSEQPLIGKDGKPLLDAAGNPLMGYSYQDGYIGGKAAKEMGNSGGSGTNWMTRLAAHDSMAGGDKFVSTYQRDGAAVPTASDVQFDESGRPFVYRMGYSDGTHHFASPQMVKMYVNPNDPSIRSIAPISGVGNAPTTVADTVKGVAGSPWGQVTLHTPGAKLIGGAGHLIQHEANNLGDMATSAAHEIAHNPLSAAKHAALAALNPLGTAGGLLSGLLFGDSRQRQAEKLAQAEAAAEATNKARQAQYAAAVAKGQLAVNPANPTAGVKVAVRPIPATPSVRVAPIAPTPSVKVAPIPATPSVKVAGPAYKAPAPKSFSLFHPSSWF